MEKLKIALISLVMLVLCYALCYLGGLTFTYGMGLDNYPKVYKVFKFIFPAPEGIINK